MCRQQLVLRQRQHKYMLCKRSRFRHCSHSRRWQRRLGYHDQYRQSSHRSRRRSSSIGLASHRRLLRLAQTQAAPNLPATTSCNTESHEERPRPAPLLREREGYEAQGSAIIGHWMTRGMAGTAVRRCLMWWTGRGGFKWDGDFGALCSNLRQRFGVWASRHSRLAVWSFGIFFDGLDTIPQMCDEKFLLCVLEQYCWCCRLSIVVDGMTTACTRRSVHVHCQMKLHVFACENLPLSVCCDL